MSDSSFSTASLPCETFSTNEEEAPVSLHIIANSSDFWVTFSERFSNFNRLARSLAYLLRFPKITRQSESFPNALSAEEIKFATQFMISKIQHAYFSDEITNLNPGKCFPKGSRIRTLTPFIDNDGLLRVGGRLQQVPFDQFNPQPYLVCN